jgi:hypothetical protein
MADNKTMFGSLLTALQAKRAAMEYQAVRDLYKSNEVSPTDPAYKLAETKISHGGGKETIEYRLYKLVDFSRVTIEAEIRSSIETGLKFDQEYSRGK